MYSLMQSLSNVICDVTQSLKLRKSSKETAHCRDHPSRSFRTPRNKDSHNMKSLLTSESRKTILSTFDADTASCQAKKHTACLQSPGIPLLVHSLVLPGLDSCISLQPTIYLSLYCSTWNHSQCHETIGLECHLCGAWNINGIGRWPDCFSLSMQKNSLGMRLDFWLQYEPRNS